MAVYHHLLTRFEGHETAATTLEWGLKHLAFAADIQRKLFVHLQAAYPGAAEDQRNPTIDEIINTSLPYLDAVIEEVLRTSHLFGGTVRATTRDTVLLGHVIPKGTDVWVMSNGPDYLTPPLPIDDSLRSKSSVEGRYNIGTWKGTAADRQRFDPERWIITENDNDEQRFNAQAGPHLAFGLGPRGCFGRRLGYLQLRILLVLLVWNFEFLETPRSLSGDAAMTRLTRTPRQCYIRLKQRSNS
jgi:cytochrome P450